MRFQKHPQATVRAVDLVAHHPAKRHSRRNRARDHALGQPRFGGKRHFRRDRRPGPARRILRPLLRQIEFAVDQRMPPAAGIGKKHADLAILDTSGSAAILPCHPGRFAALFEKTGLIDGEDAIIGAQMRDHIIAAQIAGRIRLPYGPAQHPLGTPRTRITDLLGQLPAVFALDRAQQTFEIEVCLAARIRPPKQPT